MAKKTVKASKGATKKPVARKTVRKAAKKTAAKRAAKKPTAKPAAKPTRAKKPAAKRVAKKTDRDIEKSYSTKAFVSKLRRLADALEKGKRFQIQVAGERVAVPMSPAFNIEHEREGGQEEVEFQIKWKADKAA